MKDFFIIFLCACGGLCLFLAWIAWPPKKPKKVDTTKLDKEIDRLLDPHEIKISQ